MITKGIMLICIVIFISIHMIEKNPDKASLAIKYGALYPPRVKFKKEYWRLLTANFVHVDFLHILMNVYAIYYLGSFFEKYFGVLPYIYIVLMSAILTTGITYWLSLKDSNASHHITLGASGIFYGYLGAMIALGIVFKGPYLDLLQSYMYIIVINVAITLFNSRISKTGHLGGLLGGFIGTLILIGSGICVY